MSITNSDFNLSSTAAAAIFPRRFFLSGVLGNTFKFNASFNSDIGELEFKGVEISPLEGSIAGGFSFLGGSASNKIMSSVLNGSSGKPMLKFVSQIPKVFSKSGEIITNKTIDEIRADR